MRFVLALIFCSLLAVTVSAKSFDKPVAENFSVVTLDGKPVSLSDLRGKVVVLTFWSTRCAICASEMPKLSRVAEKYAGRDDVVFLALSMENEFKVGEYVSKKPLKFTFVPNSLGVIMKYALKDSSGQYNIGYPTFFVINRNGEIEMKASGRGKTDNIDSQISRLLAS